MAKKKKDIKVSFVDSKSSEEVTGSNVFIETPNHKILLDCGMFQSNDRKEDYLVNNRKTKEYKPKELDLIFALHNHIDHIGLLPKYYKDGFRGGIITPNGSKETMLRMLLDCGTINERDILVLNAQENKKWKPTYTIEDAKNIGEYVIEFPIKEKIIIDEELSFMFVPSGHLTNGCQLVLWITCNNTTKKIVYTSDLGNPLVDNHYVGKLEYVEKCNLLIGESTYGDRKELKVRPKERDNDLKKLKTIIDTQVVQLQGKLLIPTFAQCRTAQILNMIYHLYKDDEDFIYNVYVDSPLAIDLLKILEKQVSGEELKDFKEMMNWKNLILCKDSMDSKNLVNSDEPNIVLSSSGFCTNGRVRHHLKKIVSNPNATILFCGYSSPDSLAGLLKDPKREYVEIDNKQYRIKCASYNLKSMSGHAMFETLLDYYSTINCDRVILHHGSNESKEFLAKELKRELEKKCKTTKVTCANSSLKFSL